MWGSDVSPKPSVVGPGKQFRDGIWVSSWSGAQKGFWWFGWWHASGKVPVGVDCVAGPGGQSRALHGSVMEEHWRMRMFPRVPARRYDANKGGFLALWYHTNSLELEENQN